MNRISWLVVAGLLAAPPLAVAGMLAIEWDSSGQAGGDVAVRAGKFVEVCEKLPAGARVAWSFDAAAPLAFNIHHHEGKAVHYQAKKDKVARDRGVLVAPVAQDYCWMWHNRDAADAPLRFRFVKG